MNFGAIYFLSIAALTIGIWFYMTFFVCSSYVLPLGIA